MNETRPFMHVGSYELSCLGYALEVDYAIPRLAAHVSEGKRRMLNLDIVSLTWAPFSEAPFWELAAKVHNSSPTDSEFVRIPE